MSHSVNHKYSITPGLKSYRSFQEHLTSLKPILFLLMLHFYSFCIFYQASFIIINNKLPTQHCLLSYHHLSNKTFSLLVLVTARHSTYTFLYQQILKANVLLEAHFRHFHPKLCLFMWLRHASVWLQLFTLPQCCYDLRPCLFSRHSKECTFHTKHGRICEVATCFHQ